MVFEQIFPDLAGGFVADAIRRGKTGEPKQIYAATLSFLYKLLLLQLFKFRQRIILIQKKQQTTKNIKAGHQVDIIIVEFINKLKLAITTSVLSER